MKEIVSQIIGFGEGRPLKCVGERAHSLASANPIRRVFLKGTQIKAGERACDQRSAGRAFWPCFAQAGNQG